MGSLPTEPTEVVRYFWSAMNAADAAKVRAIVGLPMAWGKGCEHLLTQADLEKRIADEVTGGDGKPRAPSFIQELHEKWDAHDEQLVAPFERLASPDKACEHEPAEVLDAVARRKTKVFLADGLLTRLSMIDDAWRVTGWSGPTDD